MLSRSLTLAVLLAAAGPLLAADGDTPLAQERGKTRPLVVIASSSVDPTLVSIKKAFNDSPTKEDLAKRNVVLFTIVNAIGQRSGKDLDAQSTMALIRELKPGMQKEGQAKIILVGKDGETKVTHDGPLDLKKDIFDTIDQMPMAEKEAAAAAPAAPAAEPKSAAQGAKPGKAGKPGKAAPAEPPASLDD